MIIDFRYFENGQEKILPVDLKLFSNRVRGWYNDYLRDQSRVEKLAYEIIFIEGHIRKLILEKPENWRADRKALMAEKKTAEDELKSIDMEAIFQNMINMTARILSDNGINDPKFSDKEFYKDNMQGSDHKQFLDDCAVAELSKKKAEIKQPSTKTA